MSNPERKKHKIAKGLNQRYQIFIKLNNNTIMISRILSSLFFLITIRIGAHHWGAFLFIVTIIVLGWRIQSHSSIFF